jgi:NADH-quinone oxidoreductase subunit L
MVIDGGVRGITHISLWLGGLFRLLQAGSIRSYAVYALLGAVIFLGVMVASGGTR